MQKTPSALLEFNQAFVDQLSDGFLHMNPDGSIIHANQTIKEWFGVGTEEIIGKSLILFFPYVDINRSYDGERATTVATGLNQAKLNVELAFFTKTDGNIDLLVRKLDDSVMIPPDHLHQQYQSLFYQNTVPIFSIDLEGLILDMNPTAQKVLGYRKEELAGRNVFHTLIVNHTQEMTKCLKKVREGKISSCDLSLKTSSGEVIEFQFSHLPIYINGHLTGAYCMARNNSDLKAVRQAFLESEYRYRQLVEHSPDPVCLHDSQRIIYVNDVTSKLLGVDKNKIIGKEITQFIHNDHHSQSQNRVKNVMRGKRYTQMFPMKIIRPDGKILETEGKSIPITENGKTYVMAVFRDVTETNEAKRSLQESERRYRSLFQHNPDGIYSINLNGELTSVNPAIEKITGFTEKEQIGKQYTEFLLADEKEDVIANYEKIFQGKTVNFEKHMTRKDGETITVRVVGFPMIVNKEIVGLYGILRDISDEKKSEELLRRSEKLTVVGELAAAIAHEIRNPLTSIKGFIQMMESGLEDKEMYYKIVLSELDRIEQIISELLVLAKPQSVSFQRKNVGDLLRHVLKLFEGQANLHNIQFVTDLEAGAEEINCEENQLKQVFINLIKNAIEVMPDGGEISVSCKVRKDGKLLIRIIDQGPGIPKDRLSRLGEPFYTTKEKGTGLGLMVSFKIIKDHKGSIHFSSREQIGTTVDVLLPLSIR